VVATSFLLTTYALPTTASLGGESHWQGEAKGFTTPLSTALSLLGTSSNEMF